MDGESPNWQKYGGTSPIRFVVLFQSDRYEISSRTFIQNRRLTLRSSIALTDVISDIKKALNQNVGMGFEIVLEEVEKVFRFVGGRLVAIGRIA